jgi:glycerophosphoryl diester phosphodiesterase
LSILWSFSAFALDIQNIPGEMHHLNAPKYIEVYAHRGARSYSPENTFPAYKTGLKIGTNWVDMDIGITKDNVIIVAHDLWINPAIISQDGKFLANSQHEFIEKLKNAPGGFDINIKPYLIHNLTLQELNKYDSGTINPNSSYAKYFPAQFAVKNTKMPPLQEVVNFVNKVTRNKINFQIEIKNDAEHPQWTASAKEYANQLYAFLSKNNLINRVEIQSFDWQPLYELRKLDKNIKLAFLFTQDDMQRMRNPDPKIAGSWSGGKLLKDFNNSLPKMVHDLGGNCYEPEDVALTEQDTLEAHKLGLKVVVWTWPEHSGKVFDPLVVQKLISFGVDGIITDDPAQLNAMLIARGLPVPTQY